MIIRIYLVFILIQMTALCKAQSFEYIYSTSDDEQVSDAAEDSAGNYYIVGYKGNSSFITNYSSIIIKLNSYGDTIKTVTLPHANNSVSQLSHVIGLNDSVFAAIGIATDTGAGFAKIWYVKFDTDLNILDQKKIGDAYKINYTSRVRKSHKNEILLAGHTWTDTSGKYEIMVYRLNLNGDSLQSFFISDSINTFQLAYDLLDLPDSSGYLIFALTYQSAQYPTQIIRTDTNGVIDTAYTLSSPIGLECISAVWLSDTTFAMQMAGGPGSSYYGLVCNLYDLNFNLFSDTILGYPGGIDKPVFKGMDAVIPDNIFGAGTINWNGFLFETNPAYYNAIKFNNNMQVQWNKIISHGTDFLNMWGIKATKDGGVLLLGTRYNYQTSGLYERDIYVVKLDSLGNFTTGINNPTATTQVHDVILYPNPAQDVINIRSTINFPATEIILFDASGREVMEKKFNKNASFSVKHLNAGIYFYKIKSAKGNEVRGKMVKE